METIFPTDTGYQGLFFVGWHRSAAGQITRTGTVVLKRTYDVQPDEDPAVGTLTPAGEALPVFMLDQPEALVTNPDFEAGIDGWSAAAGVTLSHEAEGDENHFLAVAGTPSGRVTQTIDIGSPLRGRDFVLSFKAKADAATSIAGVQLEAGGQTICQADGAVTTSWQDFDAQGVWPNNAGATRLTLVLRAASDAGRRVHYDDITLTHICYEHDMAADKPAGDLIVLPSQDRLPQEVRVNGAPWQRRPAADPSRLRVFGWEPRETGPREANGAFPSSDSAYPLPQPLPDAFANLYYNGYRRAPRAEVSAQPPGFIPAGADVRIVRSGSVDYAFHLPNEAVTAAYFYYSGGGLDEETRWQSRAVAMNLDTVVVEPDDDRCYAVWRGVWEFDERPEDSYRRLVVNGE
jgi:hypothetical protein